MANRIESFTVTIPKGTLASAPVNIATDFNPGIVERITFTVPPGPSGLMGFQFAYGNAVIIPHDNSKWLIFDDVSKDWPIDEYPTGSYWAVIGYNTDVFDHTIYVDYHITETSPPSGATVAATISPQPAPILISSIS